MANATLKTIGDLYKQYYSVSYEERTKFWADLVTTYPTSEEEKEQKEVEVNEFGPVVP